MADSCFVLNTGAKIPAIGLGTWKSEPGVVGPAVKEAIAVGYRHIDAAYFYGNEEEVGKALSEVFQEGIVQREDLFITTKLWCTYHTKPEQNLDMSLKKLGLDYVDLYLMHWPVAMNPNGNHETAPRKPDGSRDLLPERSHIDTYRDMEKLVAAGKAKAIGVANYSKPYLQALLQHVTIVPAVNQIELHPQLPQYKLIEFCKSKGIHNTAYSPFGSTGGPLLSIPKVQVLAEKKKVSPGTILLSYHVSRGCSVLPKSVTPSRIKSNWALVELSKEDMEELGHISAESPKRHLNPDFGYKFGWTDEE